MSKDYRDRVNAATLAPAIKWLVEPRYDDDGVQRTAGIDQFGREHGDPVPTQAPVGLAVETGDPLHRALREMFQRERAAFMAAVEAEQFETEDEANDFVTEDDLFPPGQEPWEDVFEFPAGDEGRSPTLAGEAPNGQNRAPVEATGQPSTSAGIASGGSTSELSKASSVEKPTLPSDSPLRVEPELRAGASARPAPGR